MKIARCVKCKKEYKGNSWSEIVTKYNLVIVGKGYSCCDKKKESKPEKVNRFDRS